MTIHLATPATPNTAVCGNAEAKKFTLWRWKATCSLCKAATAAVAFETVQRTNTLYRSDLPIRFTKLVEFVRNIGVIEDAIVEFERDKNIACSVCPTCKADMSDPIALFDVKRNRMMFACPYCTPNLHEQWEREGQ
jgi:hypothetical protein